MVVGIFVTERTITLYTYRCYNFCILAAVGLFLSDNSRKKKFRKLSTYIYTYIYMLQICK